MSLYAIGDLHLHFQSELKAPGQLNGKVWKNHEEIFRKNCEALISERDTLVLVGDHSWEKIWRSVKKTCSISWSFRDERSYLEAIMICFGMRKGQSA